MKRVKFEGRSMSKFDIAFFLSHYLHFRSIPWMVVCDVYSYSEMVSFLKEALSLEKAHKYILSFEF